MNLEDVIRRRQDEMRGRPINWRDGLADWWRDFDAFDFASRLYIGIGIAYCVAVLVGIPIWLLIHQ